MGEPIGNLVTPVGHRDDGTIRSFSLTDTDQLKVFVESTPVTGLFGFRGLTGQNNSGTPTTKFDFSASYVQLFNPTTFETVQLKSIGPLTCDCGAAGPTPDGRDQAAVFPASNWLHFYFIYDGSTVATLVSLTAPPTGPTLPTGYTHWSYAGAVRWGAGSTMPTVYLRGTRFTYQTVQVALNAGNNFGEAAINCTTFVPPNCGVYGLYLRASYSNAAANQSNNVAIILASGIAGHILNLVSQVANVLIWNSCELDVPNIAQGCIYSWGVNAGTRALTAEVTYYTVPNGAG